jgi:23S rRNA (adenine2030-N6)-methyltransferase
MAEVRAMAGADAYPGSPLIAALGLREGDTIHLAELHPAEHAALTEAMADTGAHIHKRDGLDLALALCPPTPRRGLMLIDPSYEVKADYDRIPKVLAQIARKWNVGT